MSDELKPQEPIVLDAEGHVLHDPTRGAGAHQKAEFRTVTFGGPGSLAKVLIGVGFLVMLVLGLTVAGIALGILLMTFLARTIFKPRK